MSQYLVTCDCGKQHTVGPAQAGESLKCECGNTLEIPSVRKLVHYPRADAVAVTESTWGVRSAVIFFGIYLLALSALVCLVAQFFRQSASDLSHRTPWQNWQLWQWLSNNKM